MLFRTQKHSDLSYEGLWHSGDDRRDPGDDRGPNPNEDTWRRPVKSKPASRMNAMPKYPDFGGDDDEGEKKPEVLPQQPTPQQPPPQPTARRRARAGLLRADQDPELAIGPVQPTARVVIEHTPWDRGGVASRQFHTSPYVVPEAQLSVL